MKLSGWGRYPVIDTEVTKPRSAESLRTDVLRGRMIARGNGRAYGDSAVARGKTIDMRAFNRLIAFNAENGQVIAEAGVTLEEIIAAFLPCGWFPAVTPGTKFVTIGGMVASDVHGKNHHLEGSFGNFVDWFDLMGPDGAISRCSREENPDLFAWTIGGMGLTGVILTVAFRLRPVKTGWIRQQTLVAANVTDAIRLFEDNASATYSVAWIDCLSEGDALGRSLVMLGEHATETELSGTQRADIFAEKKKRKLTIPLDAPPGLLNTWSVRAFNALYYANGRRKPKESLVDWDSYFYPLDAILGWNRIYGRKGFLQFQNVLPLDNADKGLRELLSRIAASGSGSFLAVLKRFGEQDSRFSFPMPGYTLALDFPVTEANFALMDELDQISIAHGGRFYLAKDARLTGRTLRQADPRVRDFTAMRKENGLRTHFLSAQAERLDL
ncbi:FAD-binding oxidoreductase [Rhizobium sp. G187]|uniref:FAD-binding oxidoreductase n=1 Tax=Rhizobium sp. G187 TaxID=3451352 RepID=UPI003EE62CF6